MLDELGYTGGVAIEHEDDVHSGPRFGEGLVRGRQTLYPLIGLDTSPLRAYPESMDVQLTLDQQVLACQAIESGRLHTESDAVQEALSLWEEREGARAELIASLDQAEASIVRGEGRIITRESMRELAEEVQRDLRARLAAENAEAR